MSRYAIADVARGDLDSIWHRIARDNPGAADRTMDRLKERFRLLATQPLSGQSCDALGSGLRSVSVGSYVVFFAPTDDGIEVVRVIHGARDIEGLF
jgi:toxin ParE1/3/4